MFKKRKTDKTFNHQEIAIAVGYSTIACAAYDLVSPREDGAQPQLMAQQFPLDAPDLLAQIAKWAESLHISFDLNTPFLLNCTKFHESTRLLKLDDDALALNADQLPGYLLAAVNSNSPGVDGKPILGDNVDFNEKSYSVFRVKDGTVAVTEIPRLDLTEAVGRIVDFSSINTDLDASFAPSVNLQIETPARAVARFYFDTTAGQNAEHDAATAFLLITPQGYQIALYSPLAADLVSEIAELYEKGADDSLLFVPESYSGTELTDENEDLKDKIKHAISELQTQYQDLSRFGLAKIAKVVWVASGEMQSHFYEVLDDPQTVLDFQPFALGVSYEEAIAGGLLLSCDDLTAIQPVNLMRDLATLSNEEEIEQINEQAGREASRRSYAVFALVAPFLFVVSMSIALFIDTYRTSSALAEREKVAATEKTELDPTLKLWNSYIERYKFYDDFTKQIIKFRTSQDRAITLFSELDSRYPLAVDPAFYVSELKLTADGSLEIKGMGRDEAAFTNFFRSLESSKIVKDDKYEKTFNALTFDLQQGAAKSPTDAVGQGVAPGVIVWNVKGIFAPLVAAPAQPNQPAGATPAGSQLTPATGLKPNQKIQPGA